ncbi:MAG: galactose-1-epimerase, partial [Oscillospiraceae bacterium]|nr:galactose-1-epimerase [Oscillospiraceae bacterium]
PYRANQGIAIEPEFYPDSPNHPNFPSTVLNPGDRFSKYVEYRFF